MPSGKPTWQWNKNTFGDVFPTESGVAIAILSYRNASCKRLKKLDLLYSFYSRLLFFFFSSPRFFLKQTRIQPTPYELLSQGTPIAPHVASQCPRASESSRCYHSPPKGSPAPGLAPLGSQSRRTSHWIGAAPASVGAGRRPWGPGTNVTSKLDG